MTLRLVGSDVVHVDKSTGRWVQMTRFAFDPSRDDHSVLTALIASPGYAHDYESPLDASAKATEPAVHGRWYRDQIHANLFDSWTASDAKSLINAWVDDEEWYDPGHRPPPGLHALLEPVYDLFRTGKLYKLRNPGVEAEHKNAVMGNGGFHEFVVIDRTSQALIVAVASDD